MPVRIARAAAIALAVSAILALSLYAARDRGWRQAGAPGQTEKFSTEFFGTFDTVVSFTAYAKDASEFERYLEAVRDEMTRLHQQFDIYNDYEGISNIKAVNEAAGMAPVKVSPEIIGMLETAKEAYADTGGAVNAALGPVLSVWHGYRERATENSADARVPSYAELSSASAHTSCDDIEIDRGDSTVRLRYPDMRLDVGAIAKGFAVQRAVERARAAGLKSGILNAGGNVAVIGLPPDGREAWSIGVQAPGGGAGSEVIDILSLTGGSAVTSGNYQRYFTADGVRYHHIIDPATLYPAKGVKAVTVLHPDSARADALSTAAFILPYAEARDLMAKHGAEAVWIFEDGRMEMTDGYRRLSKAGKGAGRAVM
ncbi:MAG: FAD:protein FMN transferase [Synergistaceae bacterium]|jgi:thiamine biosynthesis lipoprotein|nr:FAD:protein FMN transferase [Synergistaceae bacterium]